MWPCQGGYWKGRIIFTNFRKFYWIRDSLTVWRARSIFKQILGIILISIHNWLHGFATNSGHRIFFCSNKQRAEIGDHSEVARVKVGDSSPTEANISVFDLVKSKIIWRSKIICSRWCSNERLYVDKTSRSAYMCVCKVSRKSFSNDIDWQQFQFP